MQLAICWLFCERRFLVLGGFKVALWKELNEAEGPIAFNTNGHSLSCLLSLHLVMHYMTSSVILVRDLRVAFTQFCSFCLCMVGSPLGCHAIGDAESKYLAVGGGYVRFGVW